MKLTVKTDLSYDFHAECHPIIQLTLVRQLALE